MNNPTTNDGGAEIPQQKATSTTVTVPPPPPPAHRSYPDKLSEKEAGYVRARRRAAEQPDTATANESHHETVANSAGLACSGGGIRSATFCLGVAQSLAAQGLLAKFDFLSTVSGGGYFGSFLSRLIQRQGGVAAAEAKLKNNDSWPIRWLRENGYYLAPNGTADLWSILAQVLRNMVAIHVVLIGVFSLPFLFENALRHSLNHWGWSQSWWSRLECGYFIPGANSAWAWSPWMLPLIAVAAIGMLVPGILFWFTQFSANRNRQQDWQLYFTRWLATGLVLTVCLGLVAGMDSLGLWVYTTIKSRPGFIAGVGAVYASAAAAFAVVQKYAGKLTEAVGNKKAGLPLMVLAQLGGFAWALLFWLTLAILGHWALWQGGAPDKAVLAENAGGCWLSAGVCLAITLALAQVWGFVNLSAHQRYYAARLRRAYLGAANEKRQTDEPSIVRGHKDDDINWVLHRPDLCGGPLHLVNTTVNETISGKSQVEQRDRKGISFTVGPAGISVSADHHALWDDSQRTAPDAEQWSQIIPIPQPGWTPETFRIFPEIPGAVTKRKVEALTVGQWMGISGAAFSTGTGANTKLGLSLLLGFANVRLGYWWDSKINPRERAATRTKLIASLQFSSVISRLLPAPHSLVDEMLARFHGPAQRRWYLSDGGHFENTACYELLRRRVRFILCLDCGQDADMAFEDIANLTRKARIDLGAEIEFLAKGEVATELAEIGKRGWVPTIDPDVVASPDDFTPVKNKEGQANRDTGKAHALVARVRYDGDKATRSIIVFLKPSLTESVPVDIQNYHHANPDFPQQSTADQFFDEAQWESYRRLGEHVAGKVLG